MGRGDTLQAKTEKTTDTLEAVRQETQAQAIKENRQSTIQSVQSSTSNSRAVQFFDKHAEDLMKFMRNGDVAGYEKYLQDAVKRNALDQSSLQDLMKVYAVLQQEIRNRLLNSEAQILGDMARKDIQNGGDGRFALQAFLEYQKDYASVGWSQKKFLDYSREGLNAEQTRRLLNTALEVGFSASAVMSSTSAYENTNPSSMMITQMALVNQQFAIEIIKMFIKLAEEQTDPTKKEKYEQMISDLEEEGVGKKQFDPRKKAFEDAVKKVNDILENSELPVSPKKLVHLHSNLSTPSFASKNEDFAKRAPKEDA